MNSYQFPYYCQILNEILNPNESYLNIAADDDDWDDDDDGGDDDDWGVMMMIGG